MNTIPEILSAQKVLFKSQKTKSISYRLTFLKALKKEIQSKEQDIYNALKKDFNKPEFESFVSEYGLVISELNLAIKNANKWSRRERVKSSLLTFPSKDYIYKEPYGNILVIAPWNYPFLLAVNPLIMALASGNTVVLKPSELTINTSKLISEIIQNVFPKNVVASVEGGIETSTELLAQKWDFIFFTGSVSVGKIVAKAAAKHLTPVTLELGGKSPCIIDDSTNLKLVAKRISWGKFFNGGQTCIAPDYVIIYSKVKDEFIKHLKNEIVNRYGVNPKESQDFPRIINQKNVLRLKSMLHDCNIIFGGEIDENKCYISPTLIDNPSLDSNIMQDEIFGPILPILSYKNENDIESIIWNYDKPLSLYVFSNRKTFIKHIITKYSFGGGVINDSLIHFGNNKLPFGGVGASGMGNYHGKYGFDTFTHNKSIIKRGNWLDPSLRYAPYKQQFNFIKKLFNFFS
ncbi:aldehyde dehydrogenase (NAD+) [Flaviramulus basaltis]|uniref:Aldehyde dehydrogenase n=1 Tax=Flaviramulus basaltis TaxID=369401 RepID=A0A1K2IPA3_9FLAO|nr:aldehyde dehydrogenase [Flaviramulus basaltis]SFZ94265.1 aldehyde dehydrogenase (NAD+) [Flaviramulus basaltis]